MRKKFIVAATIAAMSNISPAWSNSDIDALKKQVEALKKDYEQRINSLETRLKKSEEKALLAQQKVDQVADTVEKTKSTSKTGSNNFNPEISVILDGRYADFENDSDDYEIPGFMLGNEAGLGEDGFSIGHTEISLSANIDDQFYGKATLAIHEHDGETETELEEAYVQTMGLGNGLTIKAGRFFSAIGYLNEQHEHSWDFADAPLIYRGLFGNRLRDDGLQVTYVAPTDLFLQVGSELFRGDRFPGGGDHDGVGAWTAFANIGGDIGIEHSWQLGFNHWRQNDVDDRTSDGHSHGGGIAETPSFTGDSKINSLDLVYKWAPNGNPDRRNFKFQFEYFDRREDGNITMLNSGPPEEMSTYDGQQDGWYAQAVYQFKPHWRTGIRYDRLSSNNKGSDYDVLVEAGLDDEGHTPERYSAMLEWLPSEYSRIRLQFNHDDSYKDSDNQLFLQYTFSLGSHGAHQF
ncbi:MAG: outer membrane beta-barrel protein [Gammaproteobacteria bacterium]|nr:outer membrane beta-barrel protein [Gammaproteobacteria bacterium]